jgi:hypothetical protein
VFLADSETLFEGDTTIYQRGVKSRQAKLAHMGAERQIIEWNGNLGD